MSSFFKYLLLSSLLSLFFSCSSPEENAKKVIEIPEKITLLFITQHSCPSCENLEETMKLASPNKLLKNYFEVKKLYLGEKLPDGLVEPNGTPTVYFLGSKNELLMEPMVGEKKEAELMEFLEDALLEFKNTYKIDLIKKRELAHAHKI